MPPLVSQRIDDLLAVAGELPDPLYHYTGQEGLLGIVREAKFHATAIQYQNDGAEMRHSYELMRTALQNPEWKEDQSIAKFIGIARSMVESQLSTLDDPYAFLYPPGPFIARLPNIYTVSFSTRGNWLSQWRAYSEPGSAYALGFETQHLVEKANSQNWDAQGARDAYSDAGSSPAKWRLVPVCYNKGLQRQVVRELIQHAVDVFLERHQDDPLGERPHNNPALNTANDLTHGLAHYGPQLKDPAFEEEREWRLVSPPFVASSVDYRTGRHTLRPFVKFGLADSTDPVLRLREVIVGPGAHAALSVAATTGLLGPPKVRLERKVIPSKIPFRDW